MNAVESKKLNDFYPAKRILVSAYDDVDEGMGNPLVFYAVEMSPLLINQILNLAENAKQLPEVTLSVTSHGLDGIWSNMSMRDPEDNTPLDDPQRFLDQLHAHQVFPEPPCQLEVTGRGGPGAHISFRVCQSECQSDWMPVSILTDGEPVYASDANGVLDWEWALGDEGIARFMDQKLAPKIAAAYGYGTAGYRGATQD